MKPSNFDIPRAVPYLPETAVAKPKGSIKRLGLPATKATLFQVEGGRVYARVSPGVWRAVNATHRPVGPEFDAAFRNARPIR